MKGKLLFTVLILFFGLYSGAQDINATHIDKKQVNGYTIKSIRNQDGTFGFLVYKGREHIIKKVNNPYTGSVTGLRKKEDAIKTAEWMVRNIISLPNAWLPSNAAYTKLKLNQKLPGSIAEKLGVSINN